MYVMRLGLKSKWMAIAFSVFTAIAAFGIGNTVQANSIATLVQETFHVSPWISGAVITLMVVYRPDWVAAFDDRRYLIGK